jgi:DMSO/TMAO reductase YedYZ molybdopterin-dependent catalytic subunit
LHPDRKNDVLRKYVVVTGSDGYQAVLALAEILPDFGGQPVLVAYERDGKALGADQGTARLVVPRDKRGGRYVSNIVRIELRDAD